MKITRQTNMPLWGFVDFYFIIKLLFKGVKQLSACSFLQFTDSGVRTATDKYVNTDRAMHLHNPALNPASTCR